MHVEACRAIEAFRILASMSEMGSVVIVPHQLAFVTPGSSPFSARFRKHSLQRLKSR
jgi:hypothetical protein